MVERFEKSPGNFTNDELLDYMSTVQTAMEKSSKAMKGVEEPSVIQLRQNNQVNVNIMDGFDRDSKERIADAIKSILAQAGSSTQVYETDYIDSEDQPHDEEE